MMSSWYRPWQELWRGDVQASDLGMRGEHRVAQMRVLLVGSFTLFSLLVAATDPEAAAYREAILLNLASLAVAVAFLVITRTGTRPPWLPYVTSLWDVSVVSFIHLAEVWQGAPSMAVNGRITFAAYFFALVGTSVREDRRVPMVAGTVAAAQYAVVVAMAARAWPTTSTTDQTTYGQFDVGVQVERVLALLLFAVACRAIAAWSQQLRAQALHDELTGLANRRTFEERLHRELLRAERRSSRVAVAIADLDHFKEVNDALGHQAGDGELRSVADLLVGAVRRTDVVARWGGDEFAVVFADSDAAVAISKMEEIRTKMSQRETASGREGRPPITLSVGVAVWPADGADAALLTRTADARLLVAKQQGRNRVLGPPAEVEAVQAKPA